MFITTVAQANVDWAKSYISYVSSPYEIRDISYTFPLNFRFVGNLALSSSGKVYEMYISYSDDT